MAEPIYPPSSRELSETRRALAPDIEKAFQAFSQNVFADGALSAKTKQLIAVAVAHVTQELSPNLGDGGVQAAAI
jgi:alkylhydroperoxidase/carboxymuconolactone decarboxylase family protein YurZ